MRKILIAVIISSMTLLTTISLPVSANDLSSTDTYPDGAPVIYVQDDSELPQAMLDNIQACENKPDLSAEKERSFNEYINNKSLNIYSEDISPFAIIRPSINIYQNPQDTNYYCGYASLQSILEYHGTYETQEDIAEVSYSSSSALAWFNGSESQATNEDYYPAAVYLNSLLLGHQYQPFNSYFGTFNSSALAEKVKYDIDVAEEGVLISGISYGNDSNGSKLPDYPAANISHWIVADGYIWDTVNQSVTGIHFVDPAKSDVVSWSAAISAYSSTEIIRMFKFASGHGIIW